MENLNDELSRAASKIIDQMTRELFPEMTEAPSIASGDPDSGDIMADLQNVYDYLSNFPSYEVWVSKMLDGDSGFVVDCRKVKGIEPISTNTTHIMIVPESMLPKLKPYIVAAGIPVFLGGGKRIILD